MLSKEVSPLPTGVRPESLRCPYPGCGFDYMHPISVEVNRGGEIMHVDVEGTVITEGSPAGRGVVISTVYLCENGHVTDLIQAFHKGMTTIEFRPVRKMRSSEYEDGNHPRTIWRD